MPLTATLTSRLVAVNTALDKDSPPGEGKFLVRRFHADEAISQLFRATVDVVTDKLFEFSFDQLLGTAMYFELPGPGNQGTRYFHGLCRRVSQSGSDNVHNHFRFELVPRVWLLTKRSQSRIFQQVKVPDILKTVLDGFDPVMVPRDLGKFELLDIVGVGAFGTVYKARDPELDRIVAIKVPRAGNLGSKEDADRFIREARSVAQLRHPSIVPVYEAGQADNLPFLVSEFVEGVTLAVGERGHFLGLQGFSQR